MTGFSGHPPHFRITKKHSSNALLSRRISRSRVKPTLPKHPGPIEERPPRQLEYCGWSHNSHHRPLPNPCRRRYVPSSEWSDSTHSVTMSTKTVKTRQLIR
ncbi:hypothetical protein AVEN_100850-1 [Araneus ventricosus]|uniref:Uncharacterized protein n=1 Tax=Araneus ventricosus TaxID=182803 RepID=A0A4Y2AY13_ARAVE|nr:hypothetical protein AVEN_100850-1 [Araneus ventricosus]